MVTERQYITPCFKQLLGDPLGQPRAVSGILGVDDNEIKAVFFFQAV